MQGLQTSKRADLQLMGGLACFSAFLLLRKWRARPPPTTKPPPTPPITKPRAREALDPEGSKPPPNPPIRRPEPWSFEALGGGKPPPHPSIPKPLLRAGPKTREGRVPPGPPIPRPPRQDVLILAMAALALGVLALSPVFARRLGNGEPQELSSDIDREG
jgi:hypothetical protein